MASKTGAAKNILTPCPFSKALRTGCLAYYGLRKFVDTDITIVSGVKTFLEDSHN